MEIAHEYPPSGEDAYVKEMVADLKLQLNGIYPKGKTERAAHPKMHGCVKAQFIVDALPPDLCVGVFKEPKVYDAYVRFSNASSVSQHDKKKDIRGMAIKLLGVSGDKILDDTIEPESQDFLLISYPSFISKGVKEFHGVVNALTKGKLTLLFFLLRNFSTFRRVMRSSQACDNVLAIPYWSTTPYLFGAGRAVKYHVQPVQPETRNTASDKANDSFLRKNMVADLSSDDIYFDFYVQFQEDPVKMPIEDATVEWTSPFVKLATIKIHKQDFDTEEQDKMGNGLSYSPWHSLPDHRPLGGLNRARREIYKAMSAFWHDNNSIYTRDK
jgi:hypothetical protein